MIHQLAHVKWFVDQNLPNVEPLSIIEWFIVLFAVAAGTVVFWQLNTRAKEFGISNKIASFFAQYSWLAPYIVRYSTALLLIINAYQGLLYAPNVKTSVIASGPTLSVLLFSAGILLLIGRGIRAAAVLMLSVYIVSLMLIRPVVDVLDHVEYIGISLYLLLYANKGYIIEMGRSKLAGLLSPTSLLRIFVGLGLVILALSEKLIGIRNSAYFLNEHNWNFLQFIGVSDRHFIIIAGIIELLVGLTLMLNFVPRLTTAILAGLMTITAILLGIEEVFGHLFALSLVAIVWLQPLKKSSPKKKRAKTSSSRGSSKASG